MDAITKGRFDEALASGTSLELARAMKVEGRSQVEIFDLFITYRALLDLQEKKWSEEEEDNSNDVTDVIVGFCRLDLKLFPDTYLTHEEIEKYRQQKQHE